MSDIKYCTKNSNEFVYKTPIKSAQKPSVCPDLSNRDLMYKDAVKSATIPNVVFYKLMVKILLKFLKICNGLLLF